MRKLSSRQSTAFCDVDLDGAGRQVGSIMIPHSPDDDAWGVTRIPVAVIGNGEGPTVIVEGGNHGDEYEGPIVISELIRDLDPDSVNGRLILLPAINVHAVFAGRRTSPVDGLNLNRTFPGEPAGSNTQQIAAFISDEVFARGDAFIDLHSGGSSLKIMPSAVVEPAADPAQRQKNIDLALSFGAPMTVVIDNMGEPRTSTATATRHGLTAMATELSGGGGVSIDALDIARRGVTKALVHLGLLTATEPSDSGGESQLLKLPDEAAYVFAGIDGVFEPFHHLGTEIRHGQEAGRIHALWDPRIEPEILHYQADGIVYSHRQPGRVRPGNCCAVVAAPYAAAP